MVSRTALVAVVAFAVVAAFGGVCDSTTATRVREVVSDPAPRHVTTLGVDVSAYQHGVDWGNAAGDGARFAYIKATEGDNYTNARLVEQYTGAAAAGISRGAFEFARPNQSDGVVQAEYFVKSLASLGGGRVDGTRTLPPMLDLESDPYTGSDGTNLCWGLTPKQMVRWISEWSDTVIGLTDRTPVIYTTAHWWQVCTGDSAAFAGYPLFIAAYASDASDLSAGAGTLPSAWSHWTFWQYTNAGGQYADLADGSKGSVPARDEDLFRGSLAELQELAAGTFSASSHLRSPRTPVPTPAPAP
ncbi:GH25 family lysozyme [Frondihabitans australicus]|uniref:Lysozyme n=1 Tax=Frondihabitans australicus TaxID=386892 RepID=A0A495II43_9MICO|nr:GH25 family lysozyme [Frondihabitans australicus]RKR75657.1 lysozyme [Frondihabitans australicus]